MPERIPTEEENSIASKAAIAESQAKIFKAELEKLQSQKSMKDLLAGPQAPTLKEQAAIDKEIAEARKSEQLALRETWKGPEVKSLEGKLAAEGTFIESRILGQQALQELVNSLLARMGKKEIFKDEKTFIIYHQSDQAAIDLYYSVLDQLRLLKTQLDTILVHAGGKPVAAFDNLAGGASVNPLLAGYALTGAIRTVADIASLFRKDVSFSNFEMLIDDLALISCFIRVIQETQSLKWKVYHPALFPVGLVRQTTNAPISKLLDAFNQLQKSYVSVDSRVRELDDLISAEQAQLLVLTDENEKRNCQEKLLVAGRERDALVTFTAIYLQLEKSFQASDANTGITPRAILLRAENLLSKLEDEGTYTIKLQAVTRGSNKITQSLFRSGKIEYSGGAELHCLVFKKDGEIVFANTDTEYLGYKSPAEIRTFHSGQ